MSHIPQAYNFTLHPEDYHPKGFINLSRAFTFNIVFSKMDGLSTSLGTIQLSPEHYLQLLNTDWNGHQINC